jgi:long-chain fatty acid transport protein
MQSGKAAALGGAFIAQADDPTAVFYNPGALALLEDKPEFTGGIAVSSNGQSLFQGVSPGIAAGFNGEQTSQETLLPHAFYVKKLGKRYVLGAGVYSPFHILTDWANVDTFPGRDRALFAELRSFDVSGNIAVKITEGLGFGLGFTYRMSDFAFTQRIRALNPLTNTTEDVATLVIDTPFDVGYGWQAGVTYRFLERYSVGANFRSHIDIDYAGSGVLTQIETGDELFDDLIAAANPFDQELGMGTSFQFPQQTGIGVAVDVTKFAKIEIDYTETEWSRFQSLTLVFPNHPLLTQGIPADFRDAATFRGGLRLRLKSGAEYRIGLLRSESPVPDETVGPLFPDADSTSVGFGYGKDWLDLAFVWTEFDGRSSSRSGEDFNGNYASNAWIFLTSISK